MKHKCHAINCKSPCAPEKLMCLKHWSMVSKSTKILVVVNYQHGQCSGCVRPSRQWLKAARKAVQEVAFQEGHIKIIREVL